MVKELWSITYGVVFDSEGYLDFDGQYGFHSIYCDCCLSPLTYKASDVTFKGLTRFGITKFFDFERGVMCVAGFSRLPVFHSYCKTRPLAEGSAEDSASVANVAAAPNGKPIATFGGN